MWVVRMRTNGISDLTGALAVGSIGFCGAFLIVDGINGMYLLIEEYASSATWAVIFTIPVLVISYAFGTVAIQVGTFAASMFERRQGSHPVETFLVIASLRNDQITSEYLRLRKHQEFLLGCSPSFIVLGIGLFSSTKWMGSFDLLGWIAGLGCLVLTAGLPLLAHQLSRSANRIGEWAKVQAHPPTA